MYTLSDICNELLIEMGESQSNKFARFYQLGVAGLRKMNFNTIGVPKVVELTISSADTAPLPNDYVRYTKIALCIDGRLYCLGEDNSLCLNKNYDDCGNPVAHGNNITPNGFVSTQYYADHYRNGENMGRFFGIGADNNLLGYYRIDKENNQILFSELTCSASVVMEYLADINSIDGDFEVHPFCVEALKDWIFWKLKQRSSKPLGEQQLAEQNFRDSSRLMRMMVTSSTKEEWVAAFQSGNQATPKM
jgi:hypothetical protein